MTSTWSVIAAFGTSQCQNLTYAKDANGLGIANIKNSYCITKYYHYVRRAVRPDTTVSELLNPASAEPSGIFLKKMPTYAGPGRTLELCNRFMHRVILESPARGSIYASMPVARERMPGVARATREIREKSCQTPQKFQNSIPISIRWPQLPESALSKAAP
ncbi:MAG TPA: hypothetical protein VME23_21945 [Terracidiphilus sp.]|nr:hypothetical protein [Terracidiphilus sp.]